jgi:predicted protein tyrosine phosphatase/GNAT superfamily N-acetyltransferase
VIKLLFIRSQNRLRSPTAERVFSTHTGLEVDSAGLNHDAINPLAPEMLEWADIVFVMERAHRNKLQKKFRKLINGKRIVCLDIPDEYEFMDPVLIRILKARVPRFLPTSALIDLQALEDIAMSKDVTIRGALIDERASLEELQRRASLANAGDREALLVHPDAIEVPVGQIRDGRVLAAECNGSLCGFAAVLPRQDGDAELDALFVEPQLQRRGIGRLLVERCAEMAGAHGARSLHVIGNPHAEAFYRACGFEQTGTTQTRFGVGLLLRKPL